MKIFFYLSRKLRKTILIIFLFKRTMSINVVRCEYGNYGIPFIPIDRIVTLGIGDDICFEKKFTANNLVKECIFVDPYKSIELKVDCEHIEYLQHLIDIERNSGKTYNRIKLDDNSYSYYPSVDGKFTSISLADIFSGREFLNTLLKIDIEGYEYDIMDDILRINDHISVLTIEFHWNWFNLKSVVKTIKSLKKLSKNGYTIVWISELGKEITLLRNESV